MLYGQNTTALVRAALVANGYYCETQAAEILRAKFKYAVNGNDVHEITYRDEETNLSDFGHVYIRDGKAEF